MLKFQEVFFVVGEGYAQLPRHNLKEEGVYYINLAI